jgi:dipeptidyl aminopeptidase/acylaminoacyl peptidase
MAVVSRSTRASAAAPTSFIVGADGTPVTPLTTERSDEIVPSWSRDGRFVYFTSDRAGREQIWRIPSDNGTAELVLDTPALGVVESPDGRALYYWRDGAVWTRPLQGGAEVRVAAHPRWESWVVRDEGLYLLNEWPLPTTDFVDLATGRRTVVRELADWPRARFPASFDLSHDGQWFLFGRVDHIQNDIMLLQHFR